jgi:FixJ family two-component response regulator
MSENLEAKTITSSSSRPPRLAANRAVPSTFACLITDMRMPGTTGIELHQELVDAGHAIPTILITAYPDEMVRAQAVRAGILCYLPKPVTSDALLACVDGALEAR